MKYGPASNVNVDGGPETRRSIMTKAVNEVEVNEFFISMVYSAIIELKRRGALYDVIADEPLRKELNEEREEIARFHNAWRELPKRLKEHQQRKKGR